MRKVLPHKFSDICNASQPVSEFHLDPISKRRLKSCQNLTNIRERDSEIRQIHIEKEQEAEDLSILVEAEVLF